MTKPRVLRITQLGEPVLRRRSKEVRLPLSAADQRLIDNMIKTMKKVQGVGIAAPQVGVSKRLFIVAPSPSARYPQSPTMPFLAMINPHLLRNSRATEEDWEGCLSVSGIRGIVPRYRSLEIEFTTREGRRLRTRLSGFVARIF